MSTVRRGISATARAIPTAGSDVFASIIAGDEAKGPAIFAAFDRDSIFPLDDLRTAEARACAVPSDVVAVCAVNRFTAYVREMEPDLLVLLEKVKFVRPVRGSGEYPPGQAHHPIRLQSRDFPSGVLFVPGGCPDTSALRHAAGDSTCAGTCCRARRNVEDCVYAVFCNQGVLCGGTQPRVDLQIYVRTDTDHEGVHSMRPDGYLGKEDFEEEDWYPLHAPNRSWAAYAPNLHEGRFDVHLHPRDGGRADFLHLRREQLFDLAEALVYHNTVLDRFVDKVLDRNILFFPWGVVVRPFAVHGGLEEMLNERIYGLSPLCFAELYNSLQAK